MALTAQQIEDALTAALTEPQSVTTDAGTLTMPSLFNQLELLKFMKNQEASRSGRNVPKFTKLRMGSTKVV